MFRPRLNRIAALGVLCAALMACDARPSPPPTVSNPASAGSNTGNPSAPSSTTRPSTASAQPSAPAVEGPECGGAVAASCADGLECVFAQDRSGGPSVSSLGHCQKQRSEGTRCVAREPAQSPCDEGLRCTLTSSDELRCRAPGAEGTMCGGAAGTTCREGLVCLMDKGTAGTCRLKGDQCGPMRCPLDKVCCNHSSDKANCVAPDSMSCGGR